MDVNRSIPISPSSDLPEWPSDRNGDEDAVVARDENKSKMDMEWTRSWTHRRITRHASHSSMVQVAADRSDWAVKQAARKRGGG